MFLLLFNWEVLNCCGDEVQVSIEVAIHAYLNLWVDLFSLACHLTSMHGFKFLMRNFADLLWPYGYILIAQYVNNMYSKHRREHIQKRIESSLAPNFTEIKHLNICSHHPFPIVTLQLPPSRCLCEIVLFQMQITWSQRLSFSK